MELDSLYLVRIEVNVLTLFKHVLLENDINQNDLITVLLIKQNLLFFMYQDLCEIKTRSSSDKTSKHKYIVEKL